MAKMTMDATEGRMDAAMMLTGTDDGACEGPPRRGSAGIAEPQPAALTD